MTPHLYQTLSERQEQALIGSLLGDGHLTQSSKNAALTISRSYSDIEYLKYESSIFTNFLAPKYRKNLVSSYFIYDKRNNRLAVESRFATINNPIFTQYRQQWYQQKNNRNIKVIPNDLKLSALAIAHWIADDGHISTNKLPYRFVLDIATQSFSRDEVRFLINLLQDRYNEKFLLKGVDAFTIRAYDSACRAVFQDINCHFKMNRKRLWDLSESRFWNDPPPRQKSSKSLFQDRQNILQDIIKNTNEISLNELYSQLAYQGKVNFKKLKPLLSGNSFIRMINPGKKTVIIFNKDQ